MGNLYNDNAPAYAAGSEYSTLTAFFDSRSDAEAAVEKLQDAGITSDKIRFMPGYEADSPDQTAGKDRSGFWAALEDWFFPDDDRAAYAEGLHRGGYLVAVNVGDALYETAHDILDDHGSIDMDERADLWRADGWEAGSSSFAGQANDGKAARHLAVSEDAFAPAGESQTIGSRDPDHGSPRVRAYHFEQGSGVPASNPGNSVGSHRRDH